MSEAILTQLRRLLVDDYHGLRERLARRFGSQDFASEVLHEAWLRLDRVGSGGSVPLVHNPQAYLYRVALNVAVDRKRAEKSRLSGAEVEALCRQAVDELDPARVAEARAELAALAEAINALPPRRRAVFIAARLENLPYKAIAVRLGVTVRVVDREIKLALDALADIVHKNPSPGGGSGPRGSSNE